MNQDNTNTQNMVVNGFCKKLHEYMGIDVAEINPLFDNEQGQKKNIFIYHALDNNPEQEFIIDIEMDLITKNAILYHIALPIHMRCKGLGTKIVIEIEELLKKLGLGHISLPAEHHSTGFWLKMGYHFKYAREQHFYKANVRRENLRIAYELEKLLGLL